VSPTPDAWRWRYRGDDWITSWRYGPKRPPMFDNPVDIGGLYLQAPSGDLPDRETLAKALYELEPHHVCGEYVDGFIVSPGGDLSWEQAKDFDAEFIDPDNTLDGGMTTYAYRAADVVLEVLLLQQPLDSLGLKPTGPLTATDASKIQAACPSDGYVFGIDENGKRQLFLHLNVSHLPQRMIDDLKAHVRGALDGPEIYQAPEHGWTCFHCGEKFTTPGGAKLHFGEPTTKRPVCVATTGEQDGRSDATEPAEPAGDNAVH
jgi:hypothetical protein